MTTTGDDHLDLTAPAIMVILTTILAVGVGMWLRHQREVSGHTLCATIRNSVVALRIACHLSLEHPAGKVALGNGMNPLTGIIEGYRSSIFGRPINWTALGISAVITLVVLVYASYYFRRMEKTFADIV